MDNGILNALISQALQVAALATLVFVIARTVGKDRPHLAHMLWALVLLKCITPPIWSSPSSVFSWLQPIATVESVAMLDQRGSDTAQTRKPSTVSEIAPVTMWVESLATSDLVSNSAALAADGRSSIGLRFFSSTRRMSWQAIAVVVWFSGILFGLILCVTRYWIFLCRLRRMAVIRDAAVEQAVNDLALRLRIRRCVRVRIIDGPTGPAVMGLIRPTILLPSMIVENRSIAQLQPLIAHELIHVRRGDLWWAMLQSVATSLWWCHPMVWVASRKLTLEAERSCDEETIAGLRCKPAAYARSLIDVLEQKNRLHVAPALPGVRPVDVTANRLERIMSLGQGSCRQTPWWVWAVMMLSAIVFLPGASRVTAQDNESPTQQPRLPRPIMASPSGPPPLPRAHPVHQTDWSVDRIEVREVLEPLMKSGLTEKAAAQQLIQSLPTAPAETLNRNAQLATEDGVVHLGGEHPYRQIVRETLYVFGSREYRQAIADQVAHFRQYGFESALISATIIQVPAEQWEELGISWHATNEAASENLSRESFGFDADVTGTVVARATEFSDSISSSPRPKSLVQQTNATSAMPKQAQLSIATLDPDSVDGLVRSIEGAQVLSRPQMVTHNGRQASVEIGQIKSLTTGFQAIRNEAGKRAYTPVTSDVHSGLRMTLRPEFVGADQLRMEFNLSISKVVSIESVSLQIPHSDKPMQIQIPEMSERNCAWNGQFSLGKTLAIGGEPIHEGDQSFRTLCLIVCQKVARTKLNSNPSAENDPSQATPTGRRFEIRRLAK